MDSMVEKVAGALRSAVSQDRGRSVPFEEMSFILARAAIEAMPFAEDGSDCPEHVRLAGETAYYENGDVRAIFNAMIDAALKEPTDA